MKASIDRLKEIRQIPIEKIRRLLNLEKLPEAIDLYPRVIEELARPYACGKPDDKNPLFHHVSYEFIKPYTENCDTNPKDYPSEGIQQTPTNNIEQLIVRYYANKLQDKELNQYFTTGIEGCDMQQCRIVLHETEDVIKNLKDKLGPITQTFSYAITPQMQTQRIAVLKAVLS